MTTTATSTISRGWKREPDTRDDCALLKRSPSAALQL
jgi:hypothetical protein